MHMWFIRVKSASVDLYYKKYAEHNLNQGFKMKKICWNYFNSESEVRKFLVNADTTILSKFEIPV